MKKIIIAGLLLNSFPLFAAEKCYRVSSEPNAFSRTPELLCVERTDTEDAKFTITLKSGLEPEVFASFNVELLMQARCIDCNESEFGVRTPSNSSFNALKIKFSGKKLVTRDTQGVHIGKETGTVSVGSTTFHYEELDLR